MNRQNKPILIGILFLCKITVDAQPAYHTIKLKLKAHDTFQEYWNQIDLINKDTIISRWISVDRYYKLLDSIPEGKYKVRLWTIFNDTYLLPDSFYAKRKLKKSLPDLYRIDEDSSIFLDQLLTGDTLFIYSQTSGCFSQSEAIAGIIKKDNLFWLIFKSSGVFHSIRITSTELETLRSFEKGARLGVKNFCWSTTNTYYTLVLNNDMFRFRKANGSFLESLINSKLPD